MLDNYLEILQQYKNPKLQYLFSSLPLPSQWQLFQTANKIDILNSQTDYLIDLYHYREIPKLLLKHQIEKLPEEFQHDLNQEEFILMLARVLDIPPSHLPFLINGTRILYDQICWLNQIHKVNFSTFLSFYIICESEARDMPESFLPYSNDQRAFLKHFSEFEKDDYGFRYSKCQDITHHQNPIKKVFYCQDFIFSLDQMSDSIQVYDSESMELKKSIYCSSNKHKTHFLGALSKTISQKTINILDIYFADSPKILGACCQDKTISFWTLTSRYSQEYSFSTESQGLQVQILYLESIKSWITVNRENQIFQWSFTQLIESNDTKAISFANSSVGTATLLPYKGPQINYVKEIPQLCQLFICTTEMIEKNPESTDKIIKSIEKKIHIWNPVKWHQFSDIKLPNKGSSVHTITYSPKLDVLFTVGYNDDVLLWKFDEGNENYNQFHKLTIREQIKNQRIENNTISAIEVFDEYGLLISLDNKGIMRCWDIESWEIIYRFNLECQIQNTISQIIKLSQGKFIVTTYRLKVLEFPKSTPRKLKVKFKPKLMQCFSQRVYVSSSNELIGFNWNNTYIEEKVQLTSEQEQKEFQSEIIFFFTHWDVTIIITQDAILHIIKDRFRTNQKGKKDSLEYPLFDNRQIEGCHFHYLYSQLTCWNKTLCRIFQSQYISKQLHFSKIREIDIRGHIQKVINCCERDVIGILLKNNILNFIQYSTMKTFSSVTMEDEIMDFHIFNDYRCIALINKRRVVFYNHIDYTQFTARFYVNTDSVSLILSLNFESLDKILEVYVPNHFKYKNISFFKQQDENNQFKYNEDQKKDFTILQQIKELKQKNEECNVLEMKISGLYKFQRTVKKILEMIRKNSIDELHRISLAERESVVDSNVSQSYVIDLDSTLVRRNGQIIQNIKVDYEIPPVDLNQFTYSKVYIYEDFHSQYFLCANASPITVGNIQSKIIERFPRTNEPYQNKDDNSKIIVSFNAVEETLLDFKEAQEVVLMNVEIEHNSINPQIINFYDHILLITFGKDDNALKFWDISCIKSLKQLIIDKEYLNLKPNQVSSIIKLKELIEYNQTHELKSQEMQVQQRTKEIHQLFKYKTKHLGSTIIDQPYLQGEYILPIEMRLKWNLKDFNSQYRINQMKETFNYMRNMLYNYQEANKYQLFQQQLQINNKIMLQQRIKSGNQLNLSEEMIEQAKLPSLYVTALMIKPEVPPTTPNLKLKHDKQKNIDLSYNSIAAILRKKDSIQDNSNEEQFASSLTQIKSPPKVKKTNKRKDKDREMGKDNQREREKEFSKEREINQEQKLKSDEQTQYEKFDQFLKSAPKKTIQLNKQLNELYYPPFEKEQKMLELERKRQKQKPELQVTTNKKTGIQLIKFSHRATDEEKRKFLMNYSFEEVALKQSQSLREYSLHNGEKSLTPFKDYLKETRNIKLNNPVKAKIKLAQLKLNENINDMVNTSASEEPYIKEELIGLKLLQKNHRNKLTGELQYIIDQNIKKYEKKESFQDALIDSHRNRSLSPLKLYLEGKQKTKKTNI